MPEPEVPVVVPLVVPPVVPVVQPTSSPEASMTRMLLEQLTASQARAAALEEAERTRLAAQARQEQDLLAEKGNTEAAKQALAAARLTHEKEVAAKDGQLAEETRRSRAAFRDREIAVALSGKPLVQGAAADLLKLFRDELETHPEGDSYTVRTKDFVSVKDFVDRELAKRPNMLLPTTQGGGGTSGGNAPAPTLPAGETLTPEQKNVARHKAAIDRYNTGGLTLTPVPRRAPGLVGDYSTN